MKTTVTVTGSDEARKLLASVGDAMESPGVMRAMETALKTAVQENFLVLNQKPNKLGGERTNYWALAADATTSSVNGLSGVVECARIGVALHLHGGTVKPTGRISEVTGKPIRLLTIPVTAAAHGKTVAMLRALGINLYRAGGSLYRHPGQAAKVDPDTDQKFFALARQANIKANPSVLPAEPELAEAAAEAARDYVAAHTG